tara:strand:- start:8704 stop:9150 length:447 start_codon:yes stop_codon:yes gene_type:complete
MSKIIQMQSHGKPWKNDQGVDCFNFEVLLDDQRSAIVTAQSETRWQVGHECEVTKEWTDKQGNKRMSLSKPKSEWQSKGGGGKSPEDQLRIGRQWSINTAINYLQLVTTSSGQLTPDEIARAARMFIDMRDGLDDFKYDQVNNDDLPF